MTPIDAWLEHYHGKPPTADESRGALQNLAGFVTLLRKAENENKKKVHNESRSIS